MKKLLTILALSSGLGLVAQNNLPQISGMSALVDTAQKKVTVTYSVSDAESDTLEISLAVSNNAGQTYFINANAVTGDVGFPILPGTGKQLVWDYSAVTAVGNDYRLKLIANDRQTVSIQSIVDQVDSLRLKNDMNIVEGVRHYTTGAAHLQEVKDTIHGRFGQYGLSPYYQNFQYGNYQAQNIIGKSAGQVSEGKMYIVDGHYDGVSVGPAADDNASAVIGVLEAARILSQYEYKNTLRFIGFDLEELGLRGSMEYVNNGLQAGETVEGVLNFEMIGYYSNRNNSQIFPAGFNLLFPNAYNEVAADSFKGNFITNVANTNSSSLRQKFDNCASQYVPDLRVISIEAPGNAQIAQDLRRSDHAPFWDKGYKALMLTDGADFRNHNYHTANDVSDSLNFGFIQHVVKATVATLAELAVPIHADMETVDVQIPNVSTPASIHEFGKSKIAVIPNPANDMALVTWEKANGFSQISLVDMAGNLVYKSNVTGNQHTLLTDVFAAGMYILKLQGKEGERTERIVIKH